MRGGREEECDSAKRGLRVREQVYVPIHYSSALSFWSVILSNEIASQFSPWPGIPAFAGTGDPAIQENRRRPTGWAALGRPW